MARRPERKINKGETLISRGNAVTTQMRSASAFLRPASVSECFQAEWGNRKCGPLKLCRHNRSIARTFLCVLLKLRKINKNGEGKKNCLFGLGDGLAVEQGSSHCPADIVVKFDYTFIYTYAYGTCLLCVWVCMPAEIAATGPMQAYDAAKTDSQIAQRILFIGYYNSLHCARCPRCTDGLEYLLFGLCIEIASHFARPPLITYHLSRLKF